MSFITRSILRWGLLGGLALGGATLLVGQQYMANTLHRSMGVQPQRRVLRARTNESAAMASKHAGQLLLPLV